MSRNKILVPEARKDLDELKEKISKSKYEIAKEEGIALKKGYNGELKAEDAGKMGGNIGGNIVKELVKRAKENLK